MVKTIFFVAQSLKNIYGAPILSLLIFSDFLQKSKEAKCALEIFIAVCSPLCRTHYVKQGQSGNAKLTMFFIII
jgi:hypothetical protein